jgi:hypothetical protein
MYCRISLRTVSRMGLICDQPTWDLASWLTFNGQGLSYFGQPLLMDGRGWFMYLGQEVSLRRLDPGCRRMELASAPLGAAVCNLGSPDLPLASPQCPLRKTTACPK